MREIIFAADGIHHDRKLKGQSLRPKFNRNNLTHRHSGDHTPETRETDLTKLTTGVSNNAKS
jgi:hypothetical protein